MDAGTGYPWTIFTYPGMGSARHEERRWPIFDPKYLQQSAVQLMCHGPLIEDASQGNPTVFALHSLDQRRSRGPQGRIFRIREEARRLEEGCELYQCHRRCSSARCRFNNLCSPDSYDSMVWFMRDTGKHGCVFLLDIIARAIISGRVAEQEHPSTVVDFARYLKGFKSQTHTWQQGPGE